LVVIPAIHRHPWRDLLLPALVQANGQRAQTGTACNKQHAPIEGWLPFHVMSGDYRKLIPAPLAVGRRLLLHLARPAAFSQLGHEPVFRVLVVPLPQSKTGRWDTNGNKTASRRDRPEREKGILGGSAHIALQLGFYNGLGTLKGSGTRPARDWAGRCECLAGCGVRGVLEKS